MFWGYKERNNIIFLNKVMEISKKKINKSTNLQV